ncbi:hypothetical protein ASG17_15090 [Brevundimonas sp. Leaf363]|nr:hypothetical protein ASG17_15090 [Brevundimonas sp. Leaf363]
MLQARLIDDFKGSPALLIWGDNADMVALLDQITGLRTDRPVVRIGYGENAVTISVSAQLDRSHIRSLPPVIWECGDDTLRRAADLIGPLLTSTGHQFIDADGLAEEVVVSANEYPTDFGR